MKRNRSALGSLWLLLALSTAPLASAREWPKGPPPFVDRETLVFQCTSALPAAGIRFDITAKPFVFDGDWEEGWNLYKVSLSTGRPVGIPMPLEWFQGFDEKRLPHRSGIWYFEESNSLSIENTEASASWVNSAWPPSQGVEIIALGGKVTRFRITETSRTRDPIVLQYEGDLVAKYAHLWGDYTALQLTCRKMTPRTLPGYYSGHGYK